MLYKVLLLLTNLLLDALNKALVFSITKTYATRKSLLLFIIGILSFSSLWAQGIIPGRVTDEEGSPIERRFGLYFRTRHLTGHVK